MTILPHVAPGDSITSQAWNSLVDQSVPTGAIVEWSSASPPVGWALCDGGSTSPWPALAAVVGANLPNRMAPVPALLGVVSGAASGGPGPLSRANGFTAIATPALQVTKTGGPSSELLVSWSASGWIAADGALDAGDESLGLTTSRVRLVQGSVAHTTKEQRYYWNRRSDHRHFGLTDKVANVPAGTWTVSLEVSGLGLATARNPRFVRDGNDEASVSVYELLPRFAIIKC